MLLYRLGKLSMEWKNLHDSNCTKVRFVAYFFTDSTKTSTDTADTIFMLYFELYQLRNALGISTAEIFFVPDICAIHFL